MEDRPLYVRTSIACFKPGMREEANRIIEGILKRWMDGYQGYIISSDRDDPDRAMYITLWDSEEAMVKAMNNLDEDTYNQIEKLSLGANVVELSKVEDYWLHLDSD